MKLALSKWTFCPLSRLTEGENPSSCDWSLHYSCSCKGLELCPYVEPGFATLQKGEGGRNQETNNKNSCTALSALCCMCNQIHLSPCLKKNIQREETIDTLLSLSATIQQPFLYYITASHSCPHLFPSFLLLHVTELLKLFFLPPLSSLLLFQPWKVDLWLSLLRLLSVSHSSPGTKGSWNVTMSLYSACVHLRTHEKRLTFNHLCWKAEIK